MASAKPADDKTRRNRGCTEDGATGGPFKGRRWKIFAGAGTVARRHRVRSEEHTSELQSLMRISYAVFCLKKKKHKNQSIFYIYINSHKLIISNSHISDEITLFRQSHNHRSESH